MAMYTFTRRIVHTPGSTANAMIARMAWYSGSGRAGFS